MTHLSTIAGSFMKIDSAVVIVCIFTLATANRVLLPGVQCTVYVLCNRGSRFSFHKSRIRILRPFVFEIAKPNLL